MAKLVGTPPLTKYSKTPPIVNRNLVIHIYQVNSNSPPPPPNKKKKKKKKTNPQTKKKKKKKKKEIFHEISEHFLNTRQH